MLLYYLVTGTFAVEGRIRTGPGKQSDRRSPRQALCQVRPDLPLPLVRAIERALQPRPDDRYATAAEFESALLDALPRTSRVLRRLSMRWPWRKGW